MTDRLSALLQEEAAALEVPAPRPGQVLAGGRRLRRRRRLGYAVGTLAIVTVIGTGVALATGGEEPRRVIEPAAPLADGPVFAVGGTVYLDGGASSVRVDDRAVLSLDYTSAGVLVRHQSNSKYTYGAKPVPLSLVTWDAEVREIGVVPEDTVPATDPAQPYLAYTEAVDGTTYVVLRDVRDGTEVSRVQLADPLPVGPVALSGDRVYVGTSDGTRYVDWRSGEIGPVDTVAGVDRLMGGRAVVGGGIPRPSSVVDVATGETLLETGAGALVLSPDGKYAVHFGDPRDPVMQRTVYSLDAGTDVALALDGASRFGIGWSPAGDLFTFDGSRQLVSCDSADGTCETTQVDLTVPPGNSESFEDDLVLGGRISA